MRSLSLFAVLVVSLVPVLAQDAAPAPKKLRVHVIGASVSGGFEDGPMFGAKEQGDSVSLQHVLKAWAGGDARVTMHAAPTMLAMFLDPQKHGQEQVAGVAKGKPDLLVAVDFPFWFAYGYVGGDEAAARKASFAAGLALLEKFDMPILLGDLPDMRGAATRMLNPRQIPKPEVLQQLNEQLAGFVKAHPNMHLVPLAQMVRTMKHEGASLPLAAGPQKTAPGALLQEDKLHATRLGMAYLGHVLQEPLSAVFPEAHALRTRRWTFEQFVEAAGAEGDLELLRAPAKRAGAAEPSSTGGGR